MKKEDFYFDLPEEQIAQTPIKERDTSKLLIMDKKTGEIEHHIFKNIINYLNEGDCLVLNNTKVIPARLIGNKKTGARVELLLLKRLEDNKWETLVNPGRKAKVGDEIYFGDNLLKATVLDIVKDGNRIVQFEYEGIFEEILDALGEMPLPPYIEERLNEKERYQTVYAKYDGSAAAPTAGLHITNELLNDLKEKGVKVAYVTLHVGLGTFRPVKAENILDHSMHTEIYNIEEEQCKIINEAKNNGKKVIAVGTTSCRTLESCVNDKGQLESGSGETDIFIYPGYEFKIVDNLITNFHLPESTLIMLVSALSTRENVLNAYNTAVKENYRFFSFGDAMFIK